MPRKAFAAHAGLVEAASRVDSRLRSYMKVQAPAQLVSLRAWVLFATAALLAACQSTSRGVEVAPPVVVTVLVTVTPGSAASANPDPAAAIPAGPVEPPYPPPTTVETEAVHQPFERGDAIWLADRNRIWIFVRPYTVVLDDETKIVSGPTLLGRGGPLLVFEDTFDPSVDFDTDPAIEPPGDLLQPKGGIGKVWRSVPELRAALGWALEWEIPYRTTVTSYPLDSGDNLQTVLTSDGRLLYVHEATAMWSGSE